MCAIKTSPVPVCYIVVVARNLSSYIPVLKFILFQLLEAVQSVHKAVKSNTREEEPPVPPYPDLGNLRLDQGRSLAQPSPA